MRPNPLCPGPPFWNISLVELPGERIIVHVEPLRRTVPCPECGKESARVHSRYRRNPRDLPWCQWSVQLVVHSRKFFCDEPECDQRVFVERFRGVLERYAHQTERFRSALLELSHVTSAEAAARVAGKLGYRTSADTLIRQQRQEQFTVTTPRVLGIDEFSLKRGKIFNTLMVDLERHRPVDIVEDRTAEPVIRWLEEHPGVQVICRDRSQAYANAAGSAAPDAIQVADRFHLVRNVYDALQKLVRSRRWDMPERDREYVGSPGHESTWSGDIKVLGEAGSEPTAMKRALWEAVRQSDGNGMGIRAIAREQGIHRETVRKYLAADSPPRYVRYASRKTKITPFLPYMCERWNAGCHNAKHLYGEIRERGYSGKYTQVKHAVRLWRTSDTRAPSPKRIDLWPLLLPSHDKLDADQREELDRVLSINPVLDRAYRLKEGFLGLIRERSAVSLDRWLVDTDGSGIKQFVALSRSFRSDYEAIRAGLSLRWSTAQCEGQITRVKLIKRQGYGRAKPDLLRQRVLHRSVA